MARLQSLLKSGACVLVLALLVSPVSSQDPPDVKEGVTQIEEVVVRGRAESQPADDEPDEAAVPPETTDVVTATRNPPPAPLAPPAWVQSCPTRKLSPVCTLGDPAFRHDGEITKMELLPGAAGKARMVTTGNDGTARLWDAKTGQLLRCFAHQKDYVWDFAVLPGSSRLITCGDEIGSFLWDLDTGNRLKEFKQGAMVFRLAADSTGKRLASGDQNNVVMLWDLDSGARLGKLRGSGKSATYTVAFDAGDKGVVVGSDDSTIRHWNLADKSARELKAKDKEDKPSSGAIGGIFKKLKGENRDNTGSIFTIVPSADKTKAAVCCGRREPWLMETATGKEIWRVKAAGVLGPKEVPEIHCAAWSPDGESLAFVGGQQLWVRKAADGSLRWKADLGRGTCYGVAWDAEGTSVYCGNGHVVGRFNAGDGKRMYPSPGSPLQNGPAEAITAAPGGEWIAECGSSPGLRLWNRKTRQISNTFLNDGDVRSVHASADGKKLLASGPKALFLLDPATGKVIHEWMRDTWGDAVLSPDGKLAVGKDSYESLAVYDTVSGGVQQRFSLRVAREDGSEISYNTDAWSLGPDMQLAAAGENGGCIWSVSRGEAIQQLEGGQPCQGCGFLGGGSPSLVTWGRGHLTLWEIPDGKEKAPSDEEIAKQVALLGSDEYTVREKATEALVAMGKPILAKLKAVESKDRETMHRLDLIQGKILKGLQYRLSDTLPMPEAERLLFVPHGDGRHWVIVYGKGAGRRVLLGEAREGKLAALCFLELPYAPASIRWGAEGSMITGNRNGTVTVYEKVIPAAK